MTDSLAQLPRLKHRVEFFDEGEIFAIGIFSDDARSRAYLEFAPDACKEHTVLYKQGDEPYKGWKVGTTFYLVRGTDLEGEPYVVVEPDLEQN